MNIYPFKAAFPKVDLITSPRSFFSNIKFQYREYRKSGFYTNVGDSGVYIYQITTQYGKHTGLVCCTDVNDLKKGKIVKHEKTLASKEQQMMHLLLQRKALVKPVLLGFNPVDKIETVLKQVTKKQKSKVCITFEDDNSSHEIWHITDETLLQKIQKSFEKLKCAYIGDGHHRTTTIALLSKSKDLGPDAMKYDQLLTAYFPFKELDIFDFNRVVDISDIMTSSQFMACLSTYLEIEILDKAQKPKSKHSITMLLDDVWYRLKWKKKWLQSKGKHIVLDSALINKYIFGKILKINDVRLDSRIKYYGGTAPLRKLVKQTEKFQTGVGFCIYPVKPKELTEMADLGKTLPPKSTWFEPRLISGIITKDL